MTNKIVIFFLPNENVKICNKAVKIPKVFQKYVVKQIVGRMLKMEYKKCIVLKD